MVAEGSTNLYFTAARVWDQVLTGLSVATNAVITAADSVLGALGKLQAQITANLSTLTSHTGSTSNPALDYGRAGGCPHDGRDGGDRHLGHQHLWQRRDGQRRCLGDS